MKLAPWLVLLLAFSLVSCQSLSPRLVTILDGDTVLSVTTSETVPLLILADAGITPQPTDRVLVNGIPYQLDQVISLDGNWHLQLIRSISVKLITPQGEQNLQTSAWTVGDFLKENGFATSLNDKVTPPLTTPITDSLTITFSPAQTMSISAGETSLTINSSAQTVGEALAQAGIPLMGMDTSVPAENEPLPTDGQITVTRVTELVQVELQSIPFSTEETESVDVAFGEQNILQTGENGIAMVKTRIRYENGVEVNRVEEDKTILKEPVKQIVAKGTKIVLSEVGGSAPYQYWYATQMYASWYSPCNSGTGGCSYGTASGAKAGFGIVAVDYSYYSYLAGMRVYIPGYGVATIGDTGGGPVIESTFGVPRYQWIDLGYDDNNIGGLSGWVTVYFLEPAPAEIPYFFK
ncbi:MAG TPA: G5 domain-containing protein [Anaerolineales bacterium]|nr:G5 domain-containing protein [Anaerolineales bacterium]